jgi:hypothetical protein
VEDRLFEADEAVLQLMRSQIREAKRRRPVRTIASYALTRFTVSTARVQDWFRGYNKPLPRERWVRPGSFGLLAHASPGFGDSTAGPLPAAPYDRDSRRWPHLSWYDRRTGEPLEVERFPSDPDERADALATGRVFIDTLGDVLGRYRHRIEHKSLAPGGGELDGEATGLLRRRSMLSAPVLTDLVGKEGNKLIERLTGEVTDADEYRVGYGSRADRWSTLVVPVLREMGAPEVARRTTRSRRAIERAIRLNHPTTPHPSTRAALSRAAGEWAAERLGFTPPAGPHASLGFLYSLLEHESADPIDALSDSGDILPPQ